MRSVHAISASELRTLACPWCGRAAGGAFGYQAVRDGRVIGVLTLGEPRSDAMLPSGSVVVSTLWIVPDEVGERVATQLLERACAKSLVIGRRWVVAEAHDGPADCRHPDEGWLERVGFVEHVRRRQWRLDLRRTAPVAGFLRTTAEALRRLLGGDGRPAPASRSRSADGV